MNGPRLLALRVTLRRLVPPALVVLIALAALPAAAQEGDAWSAKLLLDEADYPVDIVFGPDGTLYYAELNTGDLRAIPPGARAPLAEPVFDLDASPGGNGGFLGVALDPDFANTGAFFVYYSIDKDDAANGNGKVNRVSRIDADGRETVLVDDIPWAEMHDGGRLVFTGPDTLVVTTGDNELRDPAQDPNSLLGKTLRMTRAGKPAPDNPDPTKLMYTLGHRNAFGIAYDPESGTLWSTENGPHRGDEVNILRAGGNYGWPKKLGFANDPKYVDPVIATDNAIGPTGATILGGELYYGDFNKGAVHRVMRLPNGSYTETVVWRGVAHVLDVEAGPDGKLYVGSYDQIHVLTPPAGLAPPVPSTPTPSATPPSSSTPAPTPTAAPSAAPSPTPSAAPSATPPPSASPSPEESNVEDAARIPGAWPALALVALAAAALRRP